MSQIANSTFGPTPTSPPANQHGLPRRSSWRTTQLHRKTSNSSEEIKQDLKEPPAPAPAMFWHKPACFGKAPPKALRAHTMTLIGDGCMLVFGGCDARACFNQIYIFDAGNLIGIHCRHHVLVKSRNYWGNSQRSPGPLQYIG